MSDCEPTRAKTQPHSWTKDFAADLFHAYFHLNIFNTNLSLNMSSFLDQKSIEIEFEMNML